MNDLLFYIFSYIIALLYMYNTYITLLIYFTVHILFSLRHGSKSAEIFVVEKIFNHHANCKLIHSIIYRYVLFMKTTDGEFNLNIFPLVLIYLFLPIFFLFSDSIPHCIYSHNSNSIPTQLRVQQNNWCSPHIKCWLIYLHVFIVLY